MMVKIFRKLKATDLRLREIDFQKVKVLCQKLTYWLVIVVFCLMFAGCVELLNLPHQQAAAVKESLDPAALAALSRANELAFYSYFASNKVEVIKDPVVVFPKSRISVISVDGRSTLEAGVPKQNVAFFAPGKREFSVLFISPISSGGSHTVSAGNISGGMSYSSTETAIIPSNYVFEKGRHYNMEYKWYWTKPGEFIITEITDPTELAKIDSLLTEYAAIMETRSATAKANQPKIDEYKAFSRKNPKWLEGKWVNDTSKWYLEFSGDKIKYAHAGTILGESSWEGEFVFDQNTIVPLWQKFVFGRVWPRETKEMPKQEAWYYVLRGDLLEIKYAGDFIGVSGFYKKVS
ncbi:MAG: hypothetical protein LBI10_03975 [Deltaproteobacteria bacterium]|nr:hypothetical protein [Deltaproteobacteria bacterium]